MVALAILSPVFFPVRTTHRRQDRRRYYRAVRIKYARIHASGAGFPELFISMSRLTGQPIKRKLACVARAFFFSSGVFSR